MLSQLCPGREAEIRVRPPSASRGTSTQYLMNTISLNGLAMAAIVGPLLTGARIEAAPAVPEQPNIVYILADDLGYGELSCFGQQRFQTPNIDRLATEGIRLTSHYAGDTVCSPSRCCLMTGFHSGHGRIRGNTGVGPGGEAIRVGLTPEDQTLGQLLHDAGYATACIGKWGLGEEGSEGVPWRQGFDLFYGFLNDAHAHNQFPEFLYRNADKVALVPNYSHEHGQFSDDLFTAEALRYIGTHRYGQPFFLYLAFTSPHAELTPPADALEETKRKYPDLTAPGTDPSALLFAAMVVRLDQHVGAVLAKLAELGLERNTVVVFTSDNGPHREDGKDNAYFRAAGPLRGIKRDLYEGGIRVPFIARWPEHIAANTTSDLPSAFWDFPSTAAEFAGIAAPAHLDGVSFLPALLGRPQAPHAPFYWEIVIRNKASQAVRLGNWKAVRNGLESPIELYDLATDIGERHDVAAAHPNVIEQVKEIMKREHTDNSIYPLVPPANRRRLHS